MVQTHLMSHPLGLSDRGGKDGLRADYPGAEFHLLGWQGFAELQTLICEMGIVTAPTSLDFWLDRMT